ncbi:MAG: sensor histidine kinase [Roseburia sp.]
MSRIRHKIQLKKGSLTKELVMIIVGLVSGTVFLCWLLNDVFLEPYYINHKQQVLLDGLSTIDKASENRTLETEEFDVTFDNLCANGNITVLIISSDMTIVRASVNDTKKMLTEFTEILFRGGDDEVIVLSQGKNYVMQKRTDQRLEAEYLVLYGTLSNGNLILMRSALDSIRESVALAGQFLFYIGIIAIAVSTVVAIFLSKRFVTPLLTLTNLSKRMAELHFEAKYIPQQKRRNEIDELGEHMNGLSEILERTISELKSANNQLQIDIEKKTQIDHMRKEFLSSVSHELKTPLALIQGYAEGLKECINEDEQSRDFYCEVIMDEADKMNRMVKKLLTLNQLEEGNEAVTMERFDLTELIHGVLHSTEILFVQKGIRVIEDVSEPLYVWADEFMVEEVITNYLSNAIHHAAGRKEIRIHYVQRGDIVRVCVFNTGEQIPEEELAKIWFKFYKVDKARTREYGGSGIGLSIVKAIMDSHHRACGAKNRADGVEFWFELDTGSH